MASRNKKRPFSVMASAGSEMIDGSDFERIESEMRSYDENREEVIKRSRDIQKLSKQAIFSLHRSAAAEAQARLEGARKAAQELLPIIERQPTLRYGAFAAGMEEYAEAVVLQVFLEEGRLASSKEVELANNEEYLGGVLDFTGELNRYAIQRATVRDKAAVQKCRDLTDALMGVFLQFDMRNSGGLRKKYDGLKYTLRKMENTLYELSLTEAGLAKKPEEEPEPQAGGGGDAGDEA